jgi:Pin2-interacting protein X1
MPPSIYNFNVAQQWALRSRASKYSSTIWLEYAFKAPNGSFGDLLWCRRLKISHDPNNLLWSQSAESYGQKLLCSQGWRPGQGLGARKAKHFNSSAIPRLSISCKDDTLGLGASLKNQDPVNTRTGLDAFQGLLGRLNGKSDAELKKDVQKNEDRKLAMWAQRRWGGVTFVPGGMLDLGNGYKKSDEKLKREPEPQATSRNQNDVLESNDRGGHKAEKKKKKKKKKQKEKRQKSEANSAAVEAATASTFPFPSLKEAEPHAVPPGLTLSTEKTLSNKKQKRERLSSPAHDNPRATTPRKQEEDSNIASSSQALSQTLTVAKTGAVLARTGRHVIRGRNIEAKKLAFSDTKTLDQVTYSWLALLCILTRLLDFHGQELNIDIDDLIHILNDKGTVHSKENASSMFKGWIVQTYQS